MLSYRAAAAAAVRVVLNINVPGYKAYINLLFVVVLSHFLLRCPAVTVHVRFFPAKPLRTGGWRWLTLIGDVVQVQTNAIFCWIQPVIREQIASWRLHLNNRTRSKLKNTLSMSLCLGSCLTCLYFVEYSWIYIVPMRRTLLSYWVLSST